MTIHAAACTTRSTRSNRSIGWVPFALVALVVVPAIAGSLRLVELAGGPHLLPASPRLTASPLPLAVHKSDREGRILMTHATKAHMPATYHLRVEGHLDQYWAPWFGGLTLTQESDGTTSLTGAVSDQAELHGMLIKIRDLGVTLISVALVERPTRVDPQR